MPLNTQTWTLDCAVIVVTVENDKGEPVTLEIPVQSDALGVEDASHFTDLRIVPVWRRVAGTTHVASDPATSETRRIEAGTTMTYSDVPVAVDCEKPDELVADEKQQGA